MPLVSIVVAGYNAEKFAGKCLESISGQRCGDWEAVLVDDGSADNTGQLFLRLAGRDARVKVIVKENAGTSSARNRGLSFCSGEWVWFVDADDWLEAHAVEKLSKILPETDADIVGFNHYVDVPYKKWRGEGMAEWKQKAICPEVLTREGREELKWLALGALSPRYAEIRTGLGLGPVREGWSKVFRRTFLEAHGIRFDEKVSIVEDTVFCFDTFMYAKKVELHNLYLIHYRMHGESKIRRFQPDMRRIDGMTMASYGERIAAWGSGDADYRLAHLGVCADRFFEMLKCYVLHKEFKRLRLGKRRRQVLRETVEGAEWNVLREEKDLRYLPKGKRELVYCVQRGWYGATCMVGKILICGMRLHTFLCRWRTVR
jgi:glycosyltransferase involved in cell wall biosynthesis